MEQQRPWRIQVQRRPVFVDQIHQPWVERRAEALRLADLLQQQFAHPFALSLFFADPGGDLGDQIVVDQLIVDDAVEFIVLEKPVLPAH